MAKDFIVNDKRKMFVILEKLEKESGLMKDRDFGTTQIGAHLPGSGNARFWIEDNKVKLPLVKKVLQQFGLAQF